MKTLGLPSAKIQKVTEAPSTPDVSDGVLGWFRPILIVRVQTKTEDHEVQQATVEIESQGMVQPFGPRELKNKPEGQRSWSWQMLHVLPGVDLRNGEKFRIGRTEYTVMSNARWSEYGYMIYELVEDFNNGRTRTA